MLLLRLNGSASLRLVCKKGPKESHETGSIGSVWEPMGYGDVQGFERAVQGSHTCGNVHAVRVLQAYF